MRTLLKSEWLFLCLCVNIAAATTFDNMDDASGVIDVNKHFKPPELQFKQFSFDAKQMKNYINNLDRSQLIKEMLVGVEKGQNQILESIRPPALKDLFEKYNFPNVAKKGGDSKILSSISSESVQSLHRLINTDLNRPSDKRVLPDHFHENQVNGDFDLDPNVALFARITPILNVSPQCDRESRFYLENLIGNEEPPLWAIKLLDSVGKLPDGILAETKSFCAAFPCNIIFANSTLPPKIEDAIRGILDSIEIPYGNTIALGAFDECLSTTHYQNTTEGELDIIGRFSTILLNYEEDKLSSFEFEEKSNFRPVYNGDPLHLMKQEASKYENLKKSLSRIKPEDFDDPNEFPGWLKDILQLIEGTIISTAKFRWGHCAPSACDEMDFYLNYKALYENVNISNQILDLNLVAIVAHSQTEDTRKPEWKTITYVMVVVLATVAFLMVLGTVLDIVQQLFHIPMLYADKECKEDSFIAKIFKCFSVNINGRAVLNTDVAGEGHITCLNGLRSITMIWVALGHFYMFGVEYPLFDITTPLRNRGHAEAVIMSKYGNYDIIENALPSVDTFFVMGATLVSYLSLKQLEKGRFNIILFYVHRYIRITIPLAFAIGFVATIVPILWSGPVYFATQGSADACQKFGWYNVLYMNIYQDIFQPDTSAGGCLGQTWYLATDMQLYWLSPAIILPLWINWKFGIAWWVAVYASTTGIIGWLTKICQKPPTSIFGSIEPGTHLREACSKMMISADFGPFLRAQPYLIGLLFGWILYKTKSKKIKIPRVANIVLWQVSIVTMALVVWGLHDIRVEASKLGWPWALIPNSEPPAYTLAVAIIYNCFQRTAWSLSLCWIIFSCTKGYGGIVNDFLSWGFFAPFSRLTFFMYLIHIDLETMFFHSLDYSYEYDDLQFSIWFIGLTMILTGLAFVATLAFEIPFAKLEMLLIGAIMGKASRKPKSEAVGIENEKNLTKRHESITEKKFKENGHPTSEKGNEKELDKGIPGPPVISHPTDFRHLSGSSSFGTLRKLGEIDECEEVIPDIQHSSSEKHQSSKPEIETYDANKAAKLFEAKPIEPMSSYS